MSGEYLDDTHQRISEFANDFFDDDDERGGFVDHMMERAGYQRQSTWASPEPPAGGQGGQGAPWQGGGQKPKPKPKAGNGGGQGGGQRRGYFGGR